MKKIKFLCIYFVVTLAVTNGDTFADGDTVDYGDDGETTIIPRTTITDINISTSTTSAGPELSASTEKNIEQNDHETNINQTLSIFSLKNIESKFNDLIIKLDREQNIYLSDTKNSSKFREKEYKSVIKSYNKSISTVFEEFSEHFEIYKQIKNETEDKMQKIRENYMREILTIEMIWINDQIIYFKEHEKLIAKKLRYTTLNKIYVSKNSTDDIIKVKENFDEVERKMQNDSIHLKECQENYLNQTNLAELKMINNLSKLLNDTQYDAVSKKFDDFLKIKKTIENLINTCTVSSAESNGFITNYTKNLSNLNSQLVLSKIMPSNNEIVKISPKSSEVLLRKIPQSSDMTNYKWVQAYQGISRLSENAIVGGQDVDGVYFYVARIKDYKTYLYGKFAFSSGRRYAYFPYEYVEYGVEKFEILTSPNYIWCEFDKNENYDDLPICQAEHNSSVIPGTLEKNGFCRIGYNLKAYRYSNSNFKVLRIGGC